MEGVKVLFLTSGTRLAFVLNSLDTGSTETLPTATDLIRLTKDQQTDGTVALQHFRRLFCELAVKPRHVLCWFRKGGVTTGMLS